MGKKLRIRAKPTTESSRPKIRLVAIKPKLKNLSNVKAKATIAIPKAAALIFSVTGFIMGQM